MASEKKLIDANALMEELSSLTMTITGLRDGKGVLAEFMNEYRNSVLRIVDEAPTVDAVEVVHGRWKHQYEKGMSYKVCSICGCRNGLDLKFNYCPNCGAKMDGERTDNNG